MKVNLLAPNYCWHTEDLKKLEMFSNNLNYYFVSDTPPFFSRKFYAKLFPKKFFSYEFIQRLWRLILCLPWSFYVKIKLINDEPVHCHGLFSLFLAYLANINLSRIVFTPQGSDILVLPNKNKIVRNFLSTRLCKLAFITADSNILLDKVLEISPEVNKRKLILIQNGIPFSKIKYLIKNEKYERKTIDICWIRGTSEIYQFKYFLKLIEVISIKTSSHIKITIIDAFGSKYISNKIMAFKNIDISILPRLDSESFLKCLQKSKIVVSIPKSDSSPRSVYEAISFGCIPFLSNLDCFNWLPIEIKSNFLFASFDLQEDSEKLINALKNISGQEIKDQILNEDSFFYKSLNYKNIADSYLKVFQKVKESYYGVKYPKNK